MRRWMIACLLCITVSGWRPSAVFAYDIPKAAPPIQEVVLMGVEPRPDDALRLLQYDGGAGGGGDSLYPTPEAAVFWHLQFDSVIPMFDEGKRAIGCGFATEPLATLTLPDHETLSLKATDSTTAYDLGYLPTGEFGRDLHTLMCWSYAVPAGYGIQLGVYALMLTGREGTLSTTWDAHYPATPNLGYFSGGAYFIGYPANTTFPIWYYRRLSTTPRAGSFVAMRMLTTDADGAAVVTTSVQLDAPFALTELFILTDDPTALTKGDTYRVVGEYYFLNKINPIKTIFAPETPEASLSYASLWNKIKLETLTSPATVDYQAEIGGADEWRIDFGWCAENGSQLRETLPLVHLNYVIDGAVVPNEDILHYDNSICRQWATVFRGLEADTPHVLEMRYTLAERVTINQTTYAAGEYIHRVTLTVR